MKSTSPWILLTMFYLLVAVGCQRASDTEDREAGALSAGSEVVGPAWARDAGIYEVNVRQYTPEGTFAAFERHLPRLQELGVEILWFMPIYPISEERRKGSLGSYYAIADYTAVNPNFGTMEEFKALVHRIHDMGMRVILDWVPNHTGWDHHWIEEHPEWYTRDAAGNIVDPLNPETGESFGWTDVADLNYEQPALRQAMTEEMLFWLEEIDVDGFRCDVAGEVPLDYWEECIPRLRAAEPELFMLAEAEKPAHRNMGLFAMSYAWSFHHLMNAIAAGKEPAAAISAWLEKDRRAFKRGYHMQFITNHDENSWNGTVRERLGNAADAMAVLAFTIEGMPLLYSGQEAGLDKRLLFFEKDSIDWGGYSKQPFYQTLLDLKRRNRALWNGSYGGTAMPILTGNEEDVFAFYRQKDNDKVLVVLNLSPDLQEIVLKSDACVGEYTNVFANSTITVTKDMTLKLNPWDYVVWSNR